MRKLRQLRQLRLRGLGKSIDEKRVGITQIGCRTTPAHLARLLKRQRLGEPRVSWGQIFVAFRCQAQGISFILHTISTDISTHYSTSVTEEYTLRLILILTSKSGSFSGDELRSIARGGYSSFTTSVCRGNHSSTTCGLLVSYMITYARSNTAIDQSLSETGVPHGLHQSTAELGYNSIQQGESTHHSVNNMIRITHRHTPMDQSVGKIAEVMGEVVYTYKFNFECQKMDSLDSAVLWCRP